MCFGEFATLLTVLLQNAHTTLTGVAYKGKTYKSWTRDCTLLNVNSLIALCNDELQIAL